MTDPHATPPDSSSTQSSSTQPEGADAQRVADLRRDYRRASLDESSVSADPIEQFRAWFDEALAARLPEPNAMTLATVDGAGRPAARIVLLKGFDAAGFVFYTNQASRKGRELAANPHAALVLHWVDLERQVRIEGRAQLVSDAQADAYFHSRPLASRIGAWASPQSEPIADRAVIEAREAHARARFGDQPPRPPHWGGYRVEPDAIEFWQGRPSRLHDRLRYRRVSADATSTAGTAGTVGTAGTAGPTWTIERLAP